MYHLLQEASVDVLLEALEAHGLFPLFQLHPHDVVPDDHFVAGLLVEVDDSGSDGVEDAGLGEDLPEVLFATQKLVDEVFHGLSGDVTLQTADRLG